MRIGKVLFLLFFIYTSVHAQKSSQVLSRSIQMNIGVGKHGTGDLNGININTEYRSFFRKHLSISFGLGATIHDGFFPISYFDGSGGIIDASYRYTAGGIQLTGKLGVSAIKTRTSDFGFQAGPLLRYQSSSYFDEIIVLYPAATGLQTPVIAIINKTPQKTFSLGGIGQVYYNYTIRRNLFIGLLAELQIDTNGDLINELAISFGVKL